MSADRLYAVREVVTAYVDAQRPAYPHEDFRTFRRKRLAALESAYAIRLGPEGVRANLPLWTLFHSTMESLLALDGPRAGFLEDSLLNLTIARVDNPSLKLRATEALLHRHLEEARKQHHALLEALFVLLWGTIDRPLSSTELRARGFDDATEPQLSDYYDEM